MSYQYSRDCTAVENVAMALYCIANEINRLGLGNASTPMGAIEMLSLEIKETRETLQEIASNLECVSDIAGAIHEVTDKSVR